MKVKLKTLAGGVFHPRRPTEPCQFQDLAAAEANPVRLSTRPHHPHSAPWRERRRRLSGPDLAVFRLLWSFSPGVECQGAQPRAVVRKATQRLMKWLSASRGGLGGEAVSVVVETDRLVLAPLMMMVTMTEPDGRYRRLRWCNRSCCSLCSWRRRKALS
jgi:hypothetical protein